ncbi:MAG: GNAT family N-acetyltransferase [Proteobacteria bacterium]|nr:GNAT family N-acetyltransferase [Pseudomonadota bacterium]
MATALVAQLVEASEAAGFWTLQAQILDANAASKRLFDDSGFRVVGRRERLGHVSGAWHDVIMYERRSVLTGGPGLPTHSCEASWRGSS